MPGVQYDVSYAYNSNFAMTLVPAGHYLPAVLSNVTTPTVTVLFFEQSYGTAGATPNNFAPDSETCSYAYMGENRSCSAAGNGQTLQDSFAGNFGGPDFCETGYMGGGILNGWGTGPLSCSNSGGSKVNPTGLHLDGSNFAFADGHVKWLNGENVSPGYNPYIPTAYQGQSAAPCSTNSTRCAAGSLGAFSLNGPLPAATFSIY